MKYPMLGIDLGTRYAMTACNIDGNVEVLPSRWGMKRTPSVVSWSPSGWVAGEEAARREIAHPEVTFWDMKRQISRQGKIRCGWRCFAPEEVLVPLLVLLREDAEAVLNHFVTACVLTVPSAFSFAERQAIARAAYSAGFESLRIINEPTAAAFAYGKEGVSLVVDFGAGTVDVSVVEMEKGVWQVLESVGDSTIGGREIDFLMARLLEKRLHLSTEALPADDSMWRYLLGEAENIKIALSSCSNYTWQPTQALSRSSHSINISRHEFEELIRPMVLQVATIVFQLWEKYTPSHLLLVGGSSRIPFFRSVLESKVAHPEYVSQCPDEAIAMGAALFGSATEGRFLIDVLSQSLGIVSAEGNFVPVLEKGLPLPCRATRHFVSVGNGRIDLEIVQGEAESPGWMVLNRVFVDSLKKGEEVDLYFSVDSGGLLSIQLRRESGELFDIPPFSVDECLAHSEENPPELKEIEKRLARLALPLSASQQSRLMALVGSAGALVEQSCYGEAVELLSHLADNMERISL